MKSLLPFFLLCLHFSLSAQYMPKSTGEVIKHKYYTLSYNEANEQANWVYYKLTSSMINGVVSRTNNFRPDPNVSTTSAQLSDYKGSGYDRGHLAPAADMKLSAAMSESFFMSNMSPQDPSFNRGGWKNLEATVRGWANTRDIYIATGGVLSNNKGSIGSNGVTIPTHYYKVIYSPSNQKMIAFLLPNEKITNPLQNYVVSTDYIESLTGIDFFPQLSDNIENELEKSTSSAGFVFTMFKGSSSLSPRGTSVQCKGNTLSTGQRCKNKTTNPNGYCYVHQKQSLDYVAQKTATSSGKCSATTQKGTQCKRNASEGSKFCWQHQ